ncbi:Ig-like domain-containing protein [Thalassotalea fonticola]|uniref:Ig-like domain-containing protein n=1 Tax=Thalassotalea fonticola TaxID=3065649 RepID=A0ABZ0GPH0_9GAMM|nr:Ig-like domain-containing protein [Colwelliaceae bacterium S1-1]
MKQFQHFFYLFLLMFLTACDGDSFTAEDKDDVNPLEPTTTVELTINNTYVDAATPATVTAKVQTDGVAVENIVVTFSSEIGLFDVESSTALTNSDGIATIGLTAGAVEGAGTITASIETGELGTIGFESAGDGIDPDANQNQGDTDNVVLVNMSISARQVSADTFQIVTANISDLDGPVEGAVVTFSATTGYLLPASGTALTNSNGDATIIINADNVEGAGNVIATAPNGESATIGFINAGDGGVIAGKQVKLSLSNNQVSAASPATVMVTVTDEDGAVAGEVVNFSSSIGVLNPFSGTALTNATGVATITLMAGNVEGAGLISAALVTGEFDSLGFSTAGDASEVAGNEVTLTASITNISDGTPSVLTATVTNAGDPVVGEVVNFSSTLGSLSPVSGTALTNASGQAVITLSAGTNAGAGVASVTLENGATDKVGFETAGDASLISGNSVTLSISATQVDEANPVTISALVSDENGPVVGEVISFSTSLGVFSPVSGTALTDGTGLATIVLTAGSIEGAGVVTATLASGELDTIGFTTLGDASEIAGKSVSVAISNASIDANTPATLTATVTDAGNPVAGEVVNFSATLGLLSPASGTALTDVNGLATITLNAGNVAGAGVASATLDSGATDQVGFETAGDANLISGNIVSLSISNTHVDEANPVTISAMVSDEDGPVVGQVIRFSSSLGVFAPVSGTALTDGTGLATIVLTAGSIEGAGVVTATLASGELGTIGFTTLGDASEIAGKSVSVVISNASIDANAPATLTATVTDAGNPVAGEVVNFSATLGLLSPASGTALTDVNGLATITLNAGNVAGAGVASATLDSGATDKVGFETAGDESSTVNTLTLTIDNTSIDKNTPATLTATLLNGSDPVAGDVVTFTTSLGLFAPASGTALTDVNGVATITLTAGDVEGAGLVTARSSNGQVDTVGFSTAGDQVSVISVDVILVEPGTSNEISVINATTPGQLIATVTGINKQVIVTFTTDIGEIPIPTAITDIGNNQAVVDIYAGNDLGAGTVTATLKDGETGEALLVVGANNLRMGSGMPFTENVAELTLAQVSAGGTSVVTVDIVDENDNPYTLPVEVSFSSNCALLGDSTLSSPITTSNGSASSTYLAQGCVGDDPITVSANAGGVNLTASTTINILGADAGSIEFISASPENISLKGVGGEESSVVKFRVLDTTGNPVNNTVVDFSLNTEVGGINLDPVSATSDNEGIVQTIVNSGTVATSVRVTASINGSLPLISSQSSLLVVSTGIPDQDSFSLYAEYLNPEGWDVFGTQVSVTASLADAFNNPVPNGTAISFTTEGGTIEPSCITTDGVCSVTWTSTNPKPEGNELGGPNVPEVINTMGQKFGGRATILATAIGEESFPDSNGNGRFDAAEMAAFAGNDVSGNPYDLPEAFVDHNEDGAFNLLATGGENEEFTDFNFDGLYDNADTMYNGSLCAEPAHVGCATEQSLNVRGSLVLVMSGSDAYLTVNATIDAHETIDDISDLVVNITGENTGAASVIIADLHNQPMPIGTIIEFTATAGSIVGPDTFTWSNDNHNGGRAFSVSIKGEDEAKSGGLIVQITTPSGASTTYSPVSIVIDEPAVVVP